MLANIGAGPSLIGIPPTPPKLIQPPGGFTWPAAVPVPPIPTPASPTPATPPVPGGGDYYTQLLANDPQLQAVLAGIAAQKSAYQGQMTAAEQQLLEQFGEIPAGLAQQYASLVTPTVQDLAGQATAGGVSTVAQLQKQLADARTASLDSLAARGVLRSGALGQHENENLQNYNVGHYNALQSLLGNLGSQYSTYLGQNDTLLQQSQQATSDALNRIIQQIQAGILSAPGAAPAAGGGGAASPNTTPNAQTGLGTGGALSNPAINPNGYVPATAPYATQTGPLPTAQGLPKVAAPSALAPMSVKIAASPTGGSARAVGGVFAIH